MCNHQNIEEVLTPELVHWGKRICSDCGKFIGWMPHPATQRSISEAESVTAELEKQTLTDREKDFLLSIKKQKYFLTERQRIWFESMCKTYGIRTPQSYR